MAPGGALSAPGRCRGQKTSESAGRAPRPTQCTEMVPGRERPRKEPGWRLGGPSGTGRVPCFTARRGAPRPTHSALGRCRVARTLQKAATGVTTTNEDDDEDDDDTRPGLIGMCTYIYIHIYIYVYVYIRELLAQCIQENSK